jgi:hypothetical protein
LLSFLYCYSGYHQIALNVEDQIKTVFITPFDEDITPLAIHNNSPMSIQGPITRARARQLNLEVSSFLSTSLFGFGNRLLPYDYVMIRNQGEYQEILKEGLGGVVDQQGSPSQGGGPNHVDFGAVSESRSSLHLNWSHSCIWARIWVFFICMET